MIKNFVKSNFPAVVQFINRTYNHLYHLRFYGLKRATVFSAIYRKNHWSDEESVSGPGSTIQNTTTIREILPVVISKYQIDSLLDIPCGDFNWMKKMDLAHVNYLGMDIVPELIDDHTRNFSDARRTFKVADLVTDELPKVDLIFCRDCLVHLSFADIQSALANIRRSQSTYLLTTTFSEHTNFDIITGNWRPLNLQSQPFNLPSPLEIFSEGQSGENKDKSMALWRIRDLM